MRGNQVLGAGSIALGSGLAANSILGPMASEIIRYRFSEVLVSQTIGLDAAALAAVAPVAVVGGVLCWRNHAAGPPLVLGPAAFALYMLIQYVVGPAYLEYPGNNERFFALHTGLFTLSGAVFLGAWSVIVPGSLHALSVRERRAWGGILVGIATMVLFALYLGNGFLSALRSFPEFVGSATRNEYAENPVMYWIVAFLDLGIIVPAAAATGVALWRGVAWAEKGLFAILGCYALVGVSVAAMAITMVLRDDPEASVGRAVMFVALATVFVSLLAWLFRPLFRHTPSGGNEQATAFDSRVGAFLR